MEIISEFLEHSIERFATKNKEKKVKRLIKEAIYYDYIFFKNFISNSNRVKKIKNSEILVPFFPYRLDYEPLIYPIVDRLLKNGIKVTIVIPREALNSIKLKKLSGNLQILIYEDIMADIEICKKARIFIKENKIKFIENEYKKRGYDSSLKNIIGNYVFDYVIAEKIIHKISPKIVYGIHFVYNSGWLEAFKKYNIKVHLIQHGFFNGKYHDFIGSDLVYLWGEYHRTRLREMDAHIKTLVTGNPKLQLLKKIYKWDKNHETRKKLCVLFVSSGLTFSNKKIYEITFNTLKIFKKLNNIDLIFRYKLHPSERISDYNDWLEKNILNRDQIIYTNDVYQHIYEADIVIGTLSSVLNEAAYFERLVIRLYEKELMVNINDGIKKVNNLMELNEIIYRIINEKDYKEKLIETQKNKIKYFFYDNEEVIETICENLQNNIGN